MNTSMAGGTITYVEVLTHQVKKEHFSIFSRTLIQNYGFRIRNHGYGRVYCIGIFSYRDVDGATVCFIDYSIAVYGIK